MNQHIAIIAAMAENRTIGIHNRLPWRLPADWENFHKVTEGAPFLMGRNSYEAEDALISSYRNIIISTRPGLSLCNCCSQAGSVEEGLQLLADEPRIFILGGASIFAQTLHLANYLYLTIVHHSFEGDAFFPEIQWDDWQLTRSVFHPVDERHAYPFSLNEYQRV